MRCLARFSKALPRKTFSDRFSLCGPCLARPELCPKRTRFWLSRWRNFDEVRQVREDASKVAAWVNEFRAGEGVGALQESDVLTEVAEDRAIEMYASGRLSRIDTSGRSVAAYLADVGVRLVATGENLALASSARAAYEGMLDSTSGLAQLTLSAYDRAGVAVVDGPTGRLVIIVFGG